MLLWVELSMSLYTDISGPQYSCSWMHDDEYQVIAP